ncbi:MAG: ATP-dependent DNA ligase, partial [Acidobacteria bacterium]
LMRRATASRMDSLPKREATFIEPMECLGAANLPDGAEWIYEIKLDGYRAFAVKSGRTINLYSRRRKSFNSQYPYLIEALHDLPDGTVVDGEVVALDESGRPNFHLLQHYRSQASRIRYFIFDLLVCKDRDLTRLPLIERRELMKAVLELRSPRIRISEQFETSASKVLAAVREQKLEGIVAKRKDSLYESGKRTGLWVKYRVTRGQEFVIGGYIPGPHGFDSLIVGYYRDKDLIYVASVRNGFVPALRRQVFEKIRGLVSPEIPFANLPDERPSRWGESLTADKMKDCVWLRPEAVAQIEFLEWTPADRLRHSKFVGLRDDKDARGVVKEQSGET